jgi:hypothetical protein
VTFSETPVPGISKNGGKCTKNGGKFRKPRYRGFRKWRNPGRGVFENRGNIGEMGKIASNNWKSRGKVRKLMKSETMEGCDAS